MFFSKRFTNLCEFCEKRSGTNKRTAIEHKKAKFSFDFVSFYNTIDLM